MRKACEGTRRSHQKTRCYSPSFQNPSKFPSFFCSGWLLLFSIKVKNNRDFPRAERELERSGLPKPYIEAGQTLVYRARCGVSSEVCMKCITGRRTELNRRHNCRVTKERCPIENMIDIVLTVYGFLQMRRVRAVIQI